MYDDTTDNDGRVSTLFHDTTTHLEPDVPALVLGGIERGRVKRRRNAIGTACAAAVAVTGIVGVAASVNPGSGGGFAPAGASGPAATSVASSAATKPTPAPAPAEKQKPTPPPVAVADIPVRAANLPRLFTQLYPGKVTAAEERTGRIIDNGKEGQYAHFLWKGYTTTVGFMAYTGTPLQWCREVSAGAASPDRASLKCVQRADGTVLRTGRDVAPARDGGGSTNWASLYTKDGYEIFALSYNTALKEGPVLAPKPPLSIAQLTAAVTSKVWF